jgi:hypothetical protein
MNLLRNSDTSKFRRIIHAEPGTPERVDFCGRKSPYMDTVESLQFHRIHTQFHWSTRLLPVMRVLGSIPRGVLYETRILLLALSHYIGDPEVTDHCGLV